MLASTRVSHVPVGNAQDSTRAIDPESISSDHAGGVGRLGVGRAKLRKNVVVQIADEESVRREADVPSK